jgi:hypothetical protein
MQGTGGVGDLNPDSSAAGNAGGAGRPNVLRDRRIVWTGKQQLSV